MRRKITVLIFVALLAGVCTASCMTPDGGAPAEVSPPGPALRVICSAPPLYYLTTNVALLRKNIAVEMLHPALTGEEGALAYTLPDIQKAAAATVLVISNTGPDSALAEEVKKLNPGIKIIDSSKGLPAGRGPYPWMSPKSGLQQALNIAAALTELDPQGKKEIDRKTGEYRATLEKIIKGYEEMGTMAKDRKIITAGNFLAYVENDFGGPRIVVAPPEKLKDPSGIPSLQNEQGARVLFVPVAGQEKAGPGEGSRQGLSLCLTYSYYPDCYEKTMKTNLERMKKVVQ